VLLTGCSAHDAEKRLRFGWPTGITRQGAEMRVLWSWSCVAALALGVIVWALIFWCCIRYRKKGAADGDVPRQTKYNFVIEMVCVVFPVVVIAVLFWRTAVVEDDVNHLSKNPDVKVQVDAFKWNWEFEYHSMDKGQPTVYGGNDPEAGQPLATVGSDNEIPVLVVPVNQSVQVDEHSDDVIHAFWVPEFLFKRDVIPYGTSDTTRDNKFEFTATKTGAFVGRCAELCGTYHSQMNFEVRVVTGDQFKAYLAALKSIPSSNPARQALALAKAKVPGGKYATTTIPFDTDRTHLSATTGA
jgi:cytochrome c oxidase subunit 2